MLTGALVPGSGSFVPPPFGSYVPSPFVGSGSFVPPPAVVSLPPPSRPCEGEVKAGDRLTANKDVKIGGYRFRCCSILGRGSFSEVWGGETVSAPSSGSCYREVAVKDISCSSQAELQQALFEAKLLEKLCGPDPIRIPRYLAHSVDLRTADQVGGGAADAASGSGGGWRVRVAMSKAPGEPLDNFLRRQPPASLDGPNAVRRGCALASQLVRQLGPALERISKFAWHRDVNSHNILLSDACEGGPLNNIASADPEEASRRASFWLIDFGLAVDSTTWQQQWPHSDVAGDCRYWPPSSFLMSFYGPDETTARKDFCKQYKTRLDVAGLGLTALEILCSTVLSTRHAWGEGGLRGSWRRLFVAWEKYREEVTRWHTQIFYIFASGGDIGPLYQQLAKERVVDRVTEHLVTLRGLLRSCTQRAEDVRIQNLLAVLAEMIDERSTMSLMEAVDALGGAEAPAVVAAAVAAGANGSASVRPQLQAHAATPLVAAVAAPTPVARVATSTASYVPPQPNQHMPSTASYVPPQPNQQMHVQLQQCAVGSSGQWAVPQQQWAVPQQSSRDTSLRRPSPARHASPMPGVRAAVSGASWDENHAVLMGGAKWAATAARQRSVGQPRLGGS